jgi:hypothetical protein
MLKRIWLSVDWDFFQEERLEWDWHHAENRLFQDAVWVCRAFFSGEDIRGVTHPDLHEPKASTFWQRAVQNWDFSECIASRVADSHAKALPFFYSLGNIDDVADELWNFDAHHDLGYDALSTINKLSRSGIADAGSWAYVLLSRLKRLQYRHFYPAWKDPSIEPNPWSGSRIAKRVSQLSADKVPWDEKVKVTAIFIAKSTAWSPPWNDGEFQKFVETAEKATGSNVFPDDSSVTTLRDWREDVARELNEQFLKMKESGHGDLKVKESGQLPPS